MTFIIVVMVMMIWVNYVNKINPEVSLRVPPANRMPFVTVALALPETSVRADVIGCLQIGSLDLVAKENNNSHTCGL